MDNEGVVLAIDIGGTKTGLGIFKPGTGLLADADIPTLPRNGCEDLMKRAHVRAAALLEQCGESHVRGVGMLSPGPLDLTTGSIVHAPTMGWRDTPLVKITEDVFQKPVVLQHDTSGAALGEYSYGCGEPKPKCLVYITVSTGVGSGIVIDGKIYNGAFDAAGEVGHLRIEPNGADCPCGGKGCLETIASGGGISRLANEITGRRLSAKQVFELADEGEPSCTQIVAMAGRALGFGVSTLIQLFDPEVIILGGSVTNGYDQLEPHIYEVLRERVQNYSSRKNVVRKTTLPIGHNSLLGAAALIT